MTKKILFAAAAAVAIAVGSSYCWQSVQKNGPAVLRGARAIDGNGKTVTASDLRGKVVVMLFWASWCPACREEMPRMSALYEKLRRSGVEIVGVNLDSEPEAAEEVLRAQPVRWPMIHEPAGASKGLTEFYQVKSIPYVVLTDRAGQVRWSGNPDETTQTRIEELARTGGLGFVDPMFYLGEHPY